MSPSLDISVMIPYEDLAARLGRLGYAFVTVA
jgi:hypothetical protein